MLQLVTDSSCDLPEELRLGHGITIVPISVDIDGEVFHEGLDITPGEFYEKMARSRELPKTSQPPPAAFADTFRALSSGGPVVCITVSSKLSGTYQSACLGAELSGGDVTVFDSLTASAGQSLQVLRALELAQAGRTASEVVAELSAYRSEMTTLVLLNTLENIVKGGRLTRFQGSLSKILDIRVLCRDADGAVLVLERVHGRTKLIDRTLQTVGELRPDLSDRDVGITHLHNPGDTEALRQGLTQRCHPRGFVIHEMGPTMATYAGEGGIIVAF